MAPTLGDGGQLSKSMPTPLIIQADMPGLGVNAILSFGVKQSRKEQVAEGLISLLRTLAERYEDDLQRFDFEGSKTSLEQLKRRAMEELDNWRGQLRLVEEWKMKVDGRDNQMNKMRDAYFKELQHLREQVYQKSKAEKEKKSFRPNYALHFDPLEYLVDDEVALRVKEKVVLIEQEFSNRINEIEHRYRARVDSLTQQLMASRMKQTRMEMYMQKVLKDKSSEDADRVKKELGEVYVQEEKVLDSIEKETAEAEEEAVKKLTQDVLAEKLPSDGIVVTQPSDGKSSKSSGRRRSSNTSSNLGPIKESGELNFHQDLKLEDDSGLSDGSESSHDSLGSSTSLGSSVSKQSKSSSNSKISKLIGVANAVKKASSNFRRKGKSGRTKDQSTITDISDGSRVDVGVDALPYKGSFPKVKMLTRAVQSQIDGRMLDKAIDYFDKVAEDNWNLLAGITYGSENSSHNNDLDSKAGELMAPSSLRSHPNFNAGGRPKIDRSATMDLHGMVEKTEVTMVSCKRTHTIDVFGSIDWRGHFAGSGKNIFQTEADNIVLQDDLRMLRDSCQDGAFGDWQGVRGLEVASQMKITKTSHSLIKGDLAACRPLRFPVPTEDFGVQVAMTSVVMISPFEQWVPDDDDPHEVQFQQVLKMTNEILDRLPQLRQRAEKLATEAKGDSTREQEVITALASLNLIGAPSAKENVPTSTSAYLLAGSGEPTPRRVSDLSVDGVLARHGIAVGAGTSQQLKQSGGREERNSLDCEQLKERNTFSGRLSGRPRRSRRLHSLTKSPTVDSTDSMFNLLGSLGQESLTETVPHRGTGKKAEPLKALRDNAAQHINLNRIPKMASPTCNSKAESSDEQLLDPGWSGCTPGPEFLQLGVPAQRDYLEDKKKDFPKDITVCNRRTSASSIIFDGGGLDVGERKSGVPSEDMSRPSINRVSFTKSVPTKSGSFGRNSFDSRRTRSKRSNISNSTQQSRGGRSSFDSRRSVSKTVNSQTDDDDSDEDFDCMDCLEIDDCLLTEQLPEPPTQYSRRRQSDEELPVRVGSSSDIDSRCSRRGSEGEGESSMELPGIASATPRSVLQASPDPLSPSSSSRLGRLAGTASNFIVMAPSKLRTFVPSKKKDDARR